MGWRWFNQPDFQKKPVYIPSEEKTPPPEDLVCGFCGKRVKAETEHVLGKEVLKDMRGTPCPKCNRPLVAFTFIVNDIEAPW